MSMSKFLFHLIDKFIDVVCSFDNNVGSLPSGRRIFNNLDKHGKLPIEKLHPVSRGICPLCGKERPLYYPHYHAGFDLTCWECGRGISKYYE